MEQLNLDNLNNVSGGVTLSDNQVVLSFCFKSMEIGQSSQIFLERNSDFKKRLQEYGIDYKKVIDTAVYQFEDQWKKNGSKNGCFYFTFTCNLKYYRK